MTWFARRWREALASGSVPAPHEPEHREAEQVCPRCQIAKVVSRISPSGECWLCVATQEYQGPERRHWPREE